MSVISMDGKSEPTRISRIRYWGMYSCSLLCLVIPTLLITLGLTGIMSLFFENPHEVYLIPSAAIASIAVCGIDVSDGKFDGKHSFKRKK